LPDGSGREYALYTVVREEGGNNVVRILEASLLDRLGTGVGFAGTLDSQVPHPDPDFTDAQAEASSEFVERLKDNGLNDGLIAIAPHGGMIEQYTDLQAERVAERLASKGACSWRCKGWKQGGGASDRWHITSTDIHQASFPCLKRIISRGFTHAVSFHGFDNPSIPYDIIIGGREPGTLKKKIHDNIEQAIANCTPPPDPSDPSIPPKPLTVHIYDPNDPNDKQLGEKYAASSKGNIVNRLADKGVSQINGLQIEQSPRARRASAPGTLCWRAIADAVADAYVSVLPAGAVVPTTETTCPSLYFIVDRSTFSKDEVSAAMGGPFDNTLFVVLDGFLPSVVAGKPNPTRADLVAAAPQISATLVGGGPAQGFSITRTDVLLEDNSLPPEVAQRFTFVYQVKFTSIVDFPPGSPDDRRDFDLKAAWGSLEGRARLTLTTQPAPYMLDGPTPWLSTDLRVFKVREGEPPQGTTLPSFPVVTNTPLDVEQEASKYIKDLLTNMNNAGFETIKGGVDQDVLRWSKTESMKRVFNFGVARVRYRAQTQPANNVRVFFRLFKTAATGFDYDPNASYRTASTNIPLLGWRPTTQGNEIVTIPCFAERRVDTKTTSMDTQTDPANNKTLSSSGAEVYEFYGCWLDFNQGTPRFPNHPTNDGPYSGTLKSIQTLVESQHQCLVAEIHFPADPNQPGDTPGTSDNLAQRNLAIDPSANPGSAATRTVHHSFEIRASEAQPQTPNIGVASFEGEELGGNLPWRDWRAGDELMVRWGNLPQASRVTLYMPERFIDQILTLAKGRDDASYLERVDANTLRVEVIGEIAYVPLPPARAADTPALLTAELPEGVRHGEHFRVLVQQTSARAIIGTFQLSIPVREAEELLLDEERRLALLRHVVGATSPEDRWAPILRRSVELSAARVEDFGGAPNDILPSPDGAPRDTFAYDFSGFFRPVENLPALNIENAGRTIPVKFRLGGDKGLDIFAPDYPKSQPIVCGSTDLTKGTEPTQNPGKSGLSYDLKEDQYTYSWKTERAWAESCRQLVVKLRDGSFHRANFQFR
jgi:phage replication-related protein YjqB (UPF0714/DUF867 family)